MLKYIKKIFLFISLFFLYFIVKEFVILYSAIAEINIVLGYAFVVLISSAFIYFVVLPVIKIIRIPVAPAPVKNENEIDELVAKRLALFEKNDFLNKSGYVNISGISEREKYDLAIKLFESESKNLRKKYLTQLFYSTAISQNGFLDALIILSTSVNLIRETFKLYNGRVTNKDLVVIAKKIYFAIIISGTEGIENATEEIFSKFANETMKSIPFIDKIISSLVDGFISAALVTRASLIAENYCKMLYIETDRKLIPSYSVVVSTTRDITFGILEPARKKLMEIGKEKSADLFKRTVNPVTVLWDNSKEFVKPQNAVDFVADTFSSIKNKIFK